jgi:cobalt/nickel transport system permease protein
MHLADALLSPTVGIGFYAASAAALGWSTKQLGRGADTRLVPTMGVLGAFVFAAQMLNFAIPGTGSSGHLAGGMLLAAVLGPAPAFLCMTSVLLVQCLLLGDGGLLALGCNVFNLGFYPCFIGYPLYRLVAGAKPTPTRRSLGLGLGALASVELGALSVALETVASGRTPIGLGEFAGLMAGIHLPIGLVEGAVTAAAAALLWRLRPVAVADEVGAEGRVAWRRAVAAVGLAAAAAAGVLAWFASPLPDGLEWSLERAGMTPEAAEPAARAAVWPVARGKTSVEGLGGAAVVLLVSVAIGLPALWLRRRRSAGCPPRPAP